MVEWWMFFLPGCPLQIQVIQNDNQRWQWRIRHLLLIFPFQHPSNWHTWWRTTHESQVGYIPDILGYKWESVGLIHVNPPVTRVN